DVAPENTSVHGAGMSHQLGLSTDADRSDQRECTPRSSRPEPNGPLPDGRPAVLPRHSGRAPGLVDEDEVLRCDRRQQGRDQPTPVAVLRRLAFGRDEFLFFREKPSRCIARFTAARLVLTLVRSTSAASSSAAVASGRWATIRRNSSATLPLIGELLP